MIFIVSKASEYFCKITINLKKKKVFSVFATPLKYVKKILKHLVVFLNIT